MRKHKPKNQQELHNKMANKITRAIIEGPMNSGGDFADVLVLLESISVGVLLVGKELGYGEDRTVEELIRQIRERILKPEIKETIQ